MSEWIEINNVSRFSCGDFTPTGTPYNFTISSRPATTQAGNFYTGWDNAPINPSDSFYGIRLSSGSYVEITFSGTVTPLYGLSWHGMNIRPEAIGVRLDEPFELFSGTTPLYQLLTFGTPVKVSGYLPRQYNYLVLRPVSFLQGFPFEPYPRITVSGNFGFLAPTPNCLKITNVGTNICAANPTNCIRISDVRDIFRIININLPSANVYRIFHVGYPLTPEQPIAIEYVDIFPPTSFASTILNNSLSPSLIPFNTSNRFIYFRAFNPNAPGRTIATSIVTYDRIDNIFYNYIVT